MREPLPVRTWNKTCWYKWLLPEANGDKDQDLSVSCPFCTIRGTLGNLMTSHYLVFIVFCSVFAWILHLATLPRAALIFARRSVSIVQHRHTQDTRMEFTQRNDAVRSYWQQTTTEDGEERERHTDRGIILFFFFFFCSSTASLSLPSPCWAWQLSAGSRSICLSLQLSDTQSTWFPMP